MPNKKINQLDTRVGAALTDLILIGDPTSGTSFKLTATAFRTLLNNVPYAGATTNVNLGAFNLTAASIIRTGGTSSQFLKADGSVDSSTYTPTSRTLTINGTSFDLSADRSWTIAAGITGSGTSGQIAYWNGTSSQTGSNNLFWDAANARLGIGTATPTSTLDIRGKTRIQSSGNCELDFNDGSQFTRVGVNSTSGFVQTLTSIPLGFFTGALKRGEFSTNGNFILQNGGTFTDGGQRLQVMGDAFIKGSGATSATNALLIQNSGATQLFNVRNDGTTLYGSFAENARIYPSTSAGVLDTGGASLTIDIINTGSGRVIIKGANQTVASGQYAMLELIRSFVPTSGTSTYTHLSLTTTINQTGGANGITRGIYINPTITAAADWRAIEVSAGVSVLAPSTTASATLRIPSGTAPTSPVNGDIWFDGTDLKMRIGGVTKTFTLV